MSTVILGCDAVVSNEAPIRVVTAHDELGFCAKSSVFSLAQCMRIERDHTVDARVVVTLTRPLILSAHCRPKTVRST
jgi:hypothetical protein